MKQSDKKVSFQGPQNGGHFSCGKPVPHLRTSPVVRDPHIFDRKEAARGSRAREVTCRIQKWNIKAEGFHPILVANARVDWLAMDDDDITKKFPILLEGILQDVFSQRAASAWQGAQPQKLTVSMLLLFFCSMLLG